MRVSLKTEIASRPGAAWEADPQTLSRDSAIPCQRRCTWRRRPARLPLAQLHGGRQGEARAAHAQRMAERDGAAVRIHMRRVVRQPEYPEVASA